MVTGKSKFYVKVILRSRLLPQNQCFYVNLPIYFVLDKNFLKINNQNSMKKLLFIFTFLGVFGLVNVNAQCAKSASANKSCCAKKTAMATDDNAAVAKAASMDETIVTEKNGNEVTYKRKSVCAHSGSVTLVPVIYDAASGKFVNISETSKGKACAGESASKGKACAGQAATKSCCSKKGASAAVETPSTATEKM